MGLRDRAAVRRVLATLACVGACARPSAPVPRPDASPTLTGVWRLTLWVDAAHGRQARQIDGCVVLLPGQPSPSVWWARAGNVSHVGTYTIDVAALGVEPVDRRDIPVAAAIARAGHRVEIVLNPGVDHGVLSMHPVADGDSLAGRWQVSAYALGATGRFSMRRLAGERADGVCGADRTPAPGARERRGSAPVFPRSGR